MEMALHIQADPANRRFLFPWQFQAGLATNQLTHIAATVD